jgi:hypothetical protein
MQRIPHLVINNLSNPKQKKFKLQSYLATAPYFFNFSEFQAWKDSLEGRKDCLFIKNTGGKRCGESNVEYFNCNREGDYVLNGKGKRSVLSKNDSGQRKCHCLAR